VENKNETHEVPRSDGSPGQGGADRAEVLRMELGAGIPRALFDTMVDCAQARQVDLKWLCGLYRQGQAAGKAASEGVLTMAVARLGGIVEGNPTGRHNFLQRIDELVRHESAALSSPDAPEQAEPVKGPDLMSLYSAVVKAVRKHFEPMELRLRPCEIDIGKAFDEFTAKLIQRAASSPSPARGERLAAPARDVALAELLKKWQTYRAQTPRSFNGEQPDTAIVVREDALMAVFIKDLEALASLQEPAK
jgi:hypothetical protein